MIAKTGYPGGQNFRWARFHKKASAEGWLKGQNCEGQAIISEKEATKIKFRDGNKVYPYDTCGGIVYEGCEFQD